MAAEHIVVDYVNGTRNGTHCDKVREAWEVPLGIVFGFAGSVLINIGQNIQANALQASPRGEHSISQGPWWPQVG